MARASRPTKRGPDNLLPGIFIALSVVLIIGYAFLVPSWARRGSSLIQVQKDIKDNLEDPLRKGDPSVAARAVASASTLAYDNTFFSKVGKHAVDGLNYADLLAKSGYDSLAAVSDELNAVTPEQESLKAYIAKLRDDNNNLERARLQANTDLALSDAAKDKAQSLLEDASARLKAVLEQSGKDLAAAKKDYDQTLASDKEKLNEADADAKKAWAENRAEADRHKKEMAARDGRIEKLTDDLTVAQHELELKRPKKVAVSEGHILQAAPIEGYAIIDLGKREGIQNGEKFTVVRLGRGNVLIPKGELQVVRVDELVSRAEVIQADADDPITRDDLVERQKKTE